MIIAQKLFKQPSVECTVALYAVSHNVQPKCAAAAACLLLQQVPGRSQFTSPTGEPCICSMLVCPLKQALGLVAFIHPCSCCSMHLSSATKRAAPKRQRASFCTGLCGRRLCSMDQKWPACLQYPTAASCRQSQPGRRLAQSALTGGKQHDDVDWPAQRCT